ncbi:hypothetical protein Hanom_Chr16g01459371 [Helianthus anomalus]
MKPLSNLHIYLEDESRWQFVGHVFLLPSTKIITVFINNVLVHSLLFVQFL